MLACGKPGTLCACTSSRAISPCPPEALRCVLVLPHRLTWFPPGNHTWEHVLLLSQGRWFQADAESWKKGGEPRSGIWRPELFCKAQLMEQSSTRDSIRRKGHCVLYKPGTTHARSFSHRFDSFFHTQKLEEVSAHGLSRIICSDRMREGGYLVLIVSSGLFLLLATTWLVFECVFYLLKVDSDCESFVSPAVPPLWVTRQNCWLIHCSFVSPSGCRQLYLGCSFFFFFFQSGCLEKLWTVVLGTWRPTNLGVINTCYSFISSSSTSSPTPRHFPLVLHPYQGWHFCYSSSRNSVQHFCFC